jgi:hypothetical protein
MTEQKKIVISISKDSLTVMKQLGLSAEDIFSKGLHEMLRQKYHEFSLIDDDDDEEELIIEDISNLTESIAEISKFMVNEQDVTNN